MILHPASAFLQRHSRRFPHSLPGKRVTDTFNLPFSHQRETGSISSGPHLNSPISLSLFSPFLSAHIMGNGPSFGMIATVVWYREGNASYGKAGYEEAAKARFRPDDIPDRFTGKRVLVTGGNQGIGFEAAKWLAELGAEVHLACRSLPRAQDAKAAMQAAVPGAVVEVHALDVGEIAAVKRFAEDFKSRYNRLDVLINNAGCMPTERTTTSEGREAIMACTMGGTYLLTTLLQPLLARTDSAPTAGRVINVSSGGMYTVSLPDAKKTDLNFQSVSKYDGRLFYAVAKRLQVTITEVMAKRDPEKRVLYHSMHPGWAATEAVKTSINDFYESKKDMMRTARQGADTIVFLATSSKVDDQPSGQFWFDRQAVRTHLPGAGTASTPAQDESLFESVRSYVEPPGQ